MRRAPSSSVFARSAGLLCLAALVASAGCSSSGAKANAPDAGAPSGNEDAAVVDDAAPGDAAADGAEFACTVQAPTVCPEPMPHWPDVQPIFQTNCVLCHYGAVGGPWPLILYEHVRDWQDLVRDMVLDCSMPPADAGFTMSNEDRTRILEWILCGYPE